MIIKDVHGNTIDHLGGAVVSGRFGAGGSLPPKPLLCKVLGVNRAVIRESVKSLVANRHRYPVFQLHTKETFP